MGANAKLVLSDVLKKHEESILAKWLELQKLSAGSHNKIKESELREQSKEFLSLVRDAAQSGTLEGRDWEKVDEFLTQISATRAKQGFSPAETATFVFSLKQPVFERLKLELGTNPDVLVSELWAFTTLIDKLGLLTIEAYQKSREEVINRQQQELLELSTPVVKLWDGVLALPLIGTLDSARTQVVMESLLQRIVETGSGIAIIDITGVPTVDTLVAQHLLKTVAAARLMGADCIISGIRPQIAQTIVHLGVELGEVVTKSNLADALALALKLTGSFIGKLPTNGRR